MDEICNSVDRIDAINLSTVVANVKFAVELLVGAGDALITSIGYRHGAIVAGIESNSAERMIVS